MRSAGVIVGLSGYLVMLWHTIEFVRRRSTADKFDQWQLAGMSITIVTFSLILWAPNLT